MIETTDRGRLLRRLFDAGVRAALPGEALRAKLPAPPAGRLILLAAGKAAASMTRVALDHYGEFGLDRLEGLAVTRKGYGGGAPALRPVRLIEAGHPTPDRAGLEAAEGALRLAGSAGPDDLVLVLLSGGGSANWVAPAGALTFEEKRQITRDVLRSGARIDEFNALRKHLSRIKGGRLAIASWPADLVTLAISDVPNDDSSVIASGPTVADSSTLADARAVVRKYGLRLPASAEELLADPANETPKEHPVFARSRFELVGRPAEMIRAVVAAAREAGYDVLDLGPDVEGEAQAVARDHAERALLARRQGRKLAIVSGGELTVTIADGVRGGRGGPNQEYALALASRLGGEPGICALAADTDGIDGGGGEATDPAGAFVDDTTLNRAAKIGLDVAERLAAHDSTHFFETIGDLLVTGPLQTNVNDCRIILVG